MKGINKKRYVQKPTSFKKRLLNIFLSLITILIGGIRWIDY